MEEWNRWFNRFVAPVFNNQEREKYYDLLKEIQAPFFPKYWVAEKFYQRIMKDPRFDNELKLFFSFLYSCGFFMEYIISFEDWLNSNNWERPFTENLTEKSKSILDLLKEQNGVNKLKSKLLSLPFINRPEGS